MPRLRRYIGILRELRRMRLVTRHNIRAAWFQSDPDYWRKMPHIPLTDEEWDRYMEAIDNAA